MLDFGPLGELRQQPLQPPATRCEPQIAGLRDRLDHPEAAQFGDPLAGDALADLRPGGQCPGRDRTALQGAEDRQRPAPGQLVEDGGQRVDRGDAPTARRRCPDGHALSRLPGETG